MKSTQFLKVGESVEVSGKVTVVHVGSHREGGCEPRPVVEIEVETADAPAAKKKNDKAN